MAAAGKPPMVLLSESDEFLALDPEFTLKAVCGILLPQMEADLRAKFVTWDRTVLAP